MGIRLQPLNSVTMILIAFGSFHVVISTHPNLIALVGWFFHFCPFRICSVRFDFFGLNGLSAFLPIPGRKSIFSYWSCTKSIKKKRLISRYETINLNTEQWALGFQFQNIPSLTINITQLWTNKLFGFWQNDEFLTIWKNRGTNGKQLVLAQWESPIFWGCNQKHWRLYKYKNCMCHSLRSI